MTCVVGLVTNNGVYMGADRAATNSWGNTWVMNQPKIFHKYNCLMGFAGDFRAGQILQYNLITPNKKPKTDAHEWCVTSLVPDLQNVFEEHAYMAEDENCFLVALENRLFCIGSDFAVFEVTRNYLTIGDGGAYADGVLSVIDQSDPEHAITKALEAAEANCGTVLRPFDIECHDG